MAIADNKCKFNDTSNILTNIYLTGRRVEKYKDSLYFYREGRPRLSTLEDYELFRVVNEQEIPVTHTLTLEYNRYYADVEKFLDGGGAQVVYQIKSLDDCYSNMLSIEHEPRIVFPNAFYPASDREENKTFYPIISFPSEDNYLFIIFNRWGQEVYRSTLPPVYGDYSNPQGRWDGTFQGKTCPPGMYAFKITYTYNESANKYSETGSFMLVR
jgi:gliding motility-associated-like protein